VRSRSTFRDLRSKITPRGTLTPTRLILENSRHFTVQKKAVWSSASRINICFSNRHLNVIVVAWDRNLIFVCKL